MVKPMISVLYVDDEAALLDIGKIFLERTGDFSVTTIDSAPAALSLLITEKFDAIISDYLMPDMDGIMLLKQLKATGNSTPFIIFTGRGREDVVIQALNNGADFYIQKGGNPQVQFSELSHKIRQAVARRRAEERMSEVNRAFLAFRPDPLFNITILTGLAGKMLQGTCALYNRLENGKLCSLGMWNTPPGFAPCDQPEGHICNDVIQKGERSPTIITNLLESPYAETDPNVRRYQLQTYVGIPVKIGDRYLGSLCVVYQDHYSPSPQDLENLSFLAQAIAIEDQRRVAGQKLQESEEKYRKLVESSSDIIWEVDTNGVYTYVSPNIGAILGYQPEEVIGRTPFDFVAPAEVERIGSMFNECVVALQPLVRLENTNIHKDGHPVVLETSGEPVLDGAGNLLGFRGIDRDITERKQAEMRLSEINSAFLAFRPDPLFNITILTGLAGKMLQGTCALFNRLENGLLCSLGMWNTPPDFAPCNQPKGHICNDVILNGGSSPTIITNLLESPYAETDPNVRRYQLQTYVGIPVKIGDRYLGSLCVGYHDHYSPSPQDLEILSFLAQAIAIEDQRRVAGQKLQESEERFRTILNSMQSGVVVIDAHTHRILDANPKALEMIGVTSESVLGSVCHQFICPAELGKCPVTDLGQAVESSERVLLTGSGAKRSIHKSVIRTVLGGKDVLIESFVDITERKHAEEMLRESEEKYRTLFDSAGDSIFIHNEEGKILAFNTLASERLGYTTPELMSLTVKDVDSETDAQQAPERIARVMEHANLSFETMHRSKDGSLIPNEVSARHITWEGQPAVMSICRDITKRRRAEESLQQANKKLNLLSGITRHDIKNQLVALHGFLELLQNKSSDPALDQYISRITEAGNRIAEMIEFTREYDMVGVMAPVWQDCRTLVDAMTKDAPLGEIIVKNDILTGTLVYVDPMIAKVFYNLMDNAVRYGGKITTIRFSVQESGEERVILCEDNGEGVPANEKDRIFDRGIGKNTGLGLALSREILHITGITIRETGEPGKGARFEMTVPKGMWRVTGGR